MTKDVPYSELLRKRREFGLIMVGFLLLIFGTAIVFAFTDLSHGLKWRINTVVLVFVLANLFTWVKRKYF